MNVMDVSMSTYARDGQRKFQVFVSSTYIDLIEERRAVTEVLLGMGHIPVGMELFEAGNEDQWTYIKNRILEIDYYILLVAERYGSLGSKGLSYTEMEYRYAVEKKVPVASLLLANESRSSWPRNKVDFENRHKLEAFRKLCQKKLVSYWSDSGSLASKCQLALNGLIRTFPRTGWVSADQVASPQLASELARLSEENARLRAELTIRTKAGDANEREYMISRLEASFSSTMMAYSDRFSRDIYKEICKNEAIMSRLSSASFYGFIMESGEPLFDGTSDTRFDTLLRKYIGEGAVTDQYELNLLSELIRTLLLTMRTFNMIEAYESHSGTRPRKEWRLTEAARGGFQILFAQHIEGIDHPL